MRAIRACVQPPIPPAIERTRGARSMQCAFKTIERTSNDARASTTHHFAEALA